MVQNGDDRVGFPVFLKAIRKGERMNQNESLWENILEKCPSFTFSIF